MGYMSKRQQPQWDESVSLRPPFGLQLATKKSLYHKFKPTKSCVPIICKINSNFSHERLRARVHHTSYNKDTTHIMPETVLKYSGPISI